MNIPVATILGVENSKVGNDNPLSADRNSHRTFEGEQSMEPHGLPTVSEQANAIEKLEKLNMDHFFDSYCEKLRYMLR